MSIHIFKGEYPDGHISFIAAQAGVGKRIECNKIRTLAMEVKKDISSIDPRSYFLTNGGVPAAISCSPFDDIEYISPTESRMCWALSWGEKREFWKHFNEAYPE